MANRREVSETHGDEETIVVNYVFECTDTLSKIGDNFTTVYEEFIDYKIRSDVNDELPAPSMDDQKDHECANPLFGKDKPNAPHSTLSQEHSKHQIDLKIHHLHTFDGSRDFQKWQVNQQWLNVSNTFVIYSFFKYQDCFYFYLLDFIQEEGTDDEPNGGHEALVDPACIDKWIDDATTFMDATQAPAPLI